MPDLDALLTEARLDEIEADLNKRVPARDFDDRSICRELVNESRNLLAALRSVQVSVTEEADQYRRLLWIIADRHIDGLRVSDAELTAVPRLPGIVVERDALNGLSVITALPSPGTTTEEE